MDNKHFYTPGTAGGPGGRDRTLAAKSRKNAKKSAFFVQKIKIIKRIFMQKYWGKQIFTHGSFPEVGQKQKTEKKRRERERKKERLNDGNNNGQATHGARAFSASCAH